MEDNVSDALKNLNRNLKEADINLATLSKNFHIVFAEAVKRAAQDANADISQMFNAMAGKVGASEANRLKMLFEVVDEHGDKITPQKLKAKIDRIANASVNKEGTKIHLGFEWVDYDKAMAQLERFRQQYKLLKDLPGAYDTALRLSNQSVGGATAGGTVLGRAMANEMTEVQKYTKLANDELLRQQQIEQKIAEIRARGGKSAKFEGERRSIAQLNNMLEDSRRQVEAYKRTLQGLGTRGRAAAAGFGGDGSKSAIKEQTSLMRELYNLTKQYRQMQDQQRTGKVINPQDLEDTRRRLREILADMKRIEAEHPGSRKTAAARLETERLRDRWREVHRETKAATRGIADMLPTIQRVASAFGVAFSVQGLVQFGKKLVETRGEFEKQFVAIRQIIGDTDAATKIWNQTMQQALQSPFKAMQLVDYTKKLAAYRIETEKLFDTTKRLADVSAGLGVDMQRLILAYGQVKAANYLRASEVRQFTEAGVNIYGELAKYFSEIEGHAVSTAEVVERVTKRMVLFSDVEEIFKRMTDEGGVFFNMQEVQADTVWGQIQKLHDAYDQMLNTIGQGNQSTLRNLIGTLNSLVRNWREVWWFLKANLVVLGPLFATYLLGYRNLTKFGNTVVWGSKAIGGMNGIMLKNIANTKLMASTMTTWQRISLTAIGSVQAAWMTLRSAIPALLIFGIVENIIQIVQKIGYVKREVERFNKDVSATFTDKSTEMGETLTRFDDLKKKLEENASNNQKRKEIIDEINRSYGTYLPNLLTEYNSVEQLNEAYNDATEAIRVHYREKMIQEAKDVQRKDINNKKQDITDRLVKDKTKYGDRAIGRGDWNNILQLYEDAVKEYPEVTDVLDHLATALYRYYGFSAESIILPDSVLKNLEIIQQEIKAEEGFAALAFDKTKDAYKSVEDYEAALKKYQDAQNELKEATDKWNIERASKYEDFVEKAGAKLFDKRYSQMLEGEKSLEEIQAEYEDKHKNRKIVADLLIEELEKKHQKEMLDIQQKYGQITEDEYNKRLDAIYPETDDRIKQYNDKIRGLLANEFGSDWMYDPHAVVVFEQMRVGIDDISQGVAQYQKNLQGTVENQKNIVQDLYDWKERGYNIDEEDLKIQREKLAVYYRMARLLGVEVKDQEIGDAVYNEIQGKFNAKFGAIPTLFLPLGNTFFGMKPTLFPPLGNTFFGMEESDRLLSQIELLDKYTKKWKDYDSEYKALTQSMKKLKEEGASQEAVEALQQKIDEAKVNTEASKFLIDLLGYIAKNTGGGQQKESVSKMLSLLREMNSEYEKLSKSAYGYAKSQKTVSESYRSAFMEIYKGLGMKKGQGMILDFETTDFTTKSGLASAYQKLLDYVSDPKRVGKYAKDAVAQIEKALSQIKAEIDMDVSVRIREDFGRQMEEAFGNYELTLELQKLNIPEDAVKDLFPDFDYTSIGALQDIMEKFYNDRQKKDEKGNVLFSKDDLDAYKKWSDKIDSEILKMRKEKAQQYSKYLEKEYSERAKVEMKYAKDVAFVTANVSDDAQRKNILSNLQKKYQDDINELNWKSFKESDFYVEMMEDITSLPKEYTQMMLDKINEILQHPETLSPRTLKEAINARQKVLDAQMNLEPLDVMRTSVSQIRTAMNDVGGTSWKDTKEKIYEQVTATQEQINELEEEARCWDETAAKMQVYEDAVESVSVARGKLGSSTTKKLEEEGASLESILKEYKNLRTGFDEERQQLLIDFKKENLTDEEDTIRKQLIDNGYLSEGGELTSNGKDRLNYLDRQNSYYQEQIDLLNELIDKENELQSIREGQAGTDAEMQRGVGGVGTAANARARAQEARDEASEPRKRIQSLKDYLKAFTNFNESFAKFNAAINSTLNAVQGMGNAFFDMFDALGGKTDALTEGWKEFGNTMISSITNALTMIPMMVAAFTAAGIAINSAMGIIGLIAEALNLLMTAITAISKLHDAGYEKEIENQQKKIDELKSAYERLEKAIEKTWTTMTYIDTYNQLVENLKEQIEALEAQRRAENSKKKTDEDKIREYENSIQEAYDELEELEQKRIEVFGGLGEVNYRSAAEEFVSAWKDAFLETGDGLEALQEHFDEFLQEWFVKQATMRIAGAMLERTFRMIDESVNESSEGGVSVTMAELQAIRDEFASQAPLISEALEELAGMWDLGNGDGSLSGLAAGIQGMTEEQANILEAYWNSVRMYTASIDMNVAQIASILGAGGVNTNPQLEQMRLIANNTKATMLLLQSATANSHPLGGVGFKVFTD